MNYSLEDFDFDLPSGLIAQYPMAKRDDSRMLTMQNGKILDNIFKNFTSYLKPEDIVVFNDSKVIPAELHGTCRDRKHRVNLHRKISDRLWRAFILKSKYLSAGDTLVFAPDFVALIKEKDPAGDVLLEFETHHSIEHALSKYGQMPLPPYIKRLEGGEPCDKETYQTIYAKANGSVAAPTAGLHFSSAILKEIEQKANTCFVTLHVGAGTFLPVKTSDINQHKMHSEYFEISEEAASKINKAKENGGRVIAIGTTSVRTLESAMRGKNKLEAMTGETDIFITPGYKFAIVDCLLTNFHLPKSTLFMLICAFAGYKNMHDAYKHAIDNNYRFFSYGDSCFLIRPD